MKFTDAARKMYACRAGTDAVFPAEARREFIGRGDELCRLVTRIQLSDEGLWRLLEAQFASDPDDADRGWRGEFWGKLMRGGAFVYRYTEDPALYQVLEASCRRMLTNQQENGAFSTYRRRQFEGWDLWCRKYILLGFQYFLEICRDPALTAEIIAALSRHLDAILSEIGQGKLEITKASDHWLGVNSCSILEPVMRQYALTGEKSYLDFAAYIVSTGGVDDPADLIELARQGIPPYEFPETKAYETMSFFEGVLEYYRVTGEERLREAVVALGRSIARDCVSVIGSCGCRKEQFDCTARRQTDPENRIIMQETCVTVTWMKLCWQLYCLTGEPQWLDQMERSYANGLFGAVNTGGRTENYGFAFDSYSPLMFSTRGRKTGGLKNIAPDRYCGCCAAIGACGLGLVPFAAVTEDRQAVRIGFTLPGTVTAETYTLHMTVEETVCARTVTLTTTGGAGRALKVRIPDWAGEVISDGRTEVGWLVWESFPAKTVITFTTPVRILRQDGFLCLRHGPHILARDARCGQDITAPVTVGASAVPEPCTLSFTAEKAFRIGGTLLADYASCGTTWNETSALTVWLKDSGEA